jgi:signal transduction histidine kinase
MFWASNQSNIIMFAWLMDILVESLVHIGIFYLLYVLITKHDLPFFQKVLFVLLYVPIPIFLHTNLMLNGFDLTSCLATEGPLALYYTYFVEALTTLWLIAFLIYRYSHTSETDTKNEILSLGSGGILFLLAFSWGNITGSFSDNWQLGQYGLWGMPLFGGFLLYSVVKFKTFKIRLLSTEALIVSSWLILFLLLFINDIQKARIIIIVTLIFFGILGYRLIKSTKNEVQQREQIEKLALGLEKANDQLKVLDKMKSEFVSIASHQLRSPLTSVRGYASMLLEGSFGALSPKAKEAVERIHESSRFMASSVEDYLNVSRIQAGNMKYEYSDFNLKDVAMHTVDDTRQIALKKGLLLTFKSDLTKQGIVHADIGKTRQVIDNLINNSLKYTPKGSINVFVRDDVKLKKIYVEISDTGIGMASHTLENIFGKFERASNANEVNVTGTGLGLYIARKMAREMGGDVTAFSEGENKGSTFRIELPLMM